MYSPHVRLQWPHGVVRGAPLEPIDERGVFIICSVSPAFELISIISWIPRKVVEVQHNLA
jgi:hypothetical protein